MSKRNMMILGAAAGLGLLIFAVWAWNKSRARALASQPAPAGDGPTGGRVNRFTIPPVVIDTSGGASAGARSSDDVGAA